MNREVETIREKVHTTADAALFLCFQEVKGSHSKGVIRLPLLHYDIPFEGYGEMLLRMNRIYDLLGMPDAGSCMRSLSEGEKEEWEFTDEMKNNQDTTLPAGTERMVSIQIQFRQHCSLQGFLICGKQKAGFRSALEMLYLLEEWRYRNERSIFDMHKTRAAVLILFLASTLAFGGCLVRQQTGKDGKGPEITMDNSEISASIHAEESELLAGVTAYDKKDGDVTSSLAVEHISNFVEKGRRKISIVAFDSDNHVTHAERELVYNDYTSPVFSLDRPLRFSLNADDLTEGLSAEDCLDGTITDRIRISYEDEISSTLGLYHVTYSVANRAGDVTSLPVTVELYDPAEENGKPQITLSDYLIHLDLQQPFDPQAYLESVSVDQMLYEKREDGALHAASYEEELLGENQFSIDNPVDTGSAGVYEVTYTATAEDGQTSSVRLIVCVNE